MKITESRLRQIIREAILAESNKDQIPIHDAPVTFEFVEEELGGVGRSFYVEASHPGTDRVGFIKAIPYWDELTERGMSLPKRTINVHKDVEIYTVDLALLDNIFKGEGLGTQMYKFLIANLSKINIALVPAEWTRNSDRESKNSLAVHMMNNDLKKLPVGERGTSHDALRVWRNLGEIPAFHPEWNPEDYRTFQSTRKRGWKDRIKSKRNDFSIDEALIRKKLLAEAAITPAGAKERGITFEVYIFKGNAEISVVIGDDDEAVVGQLRAGQERRACNPDQESAWAIYKSSTSIKGLGPLMYDLMIDLVHPAPLIADRLRVSLAAKNVWDYYMNSRNDIEVLQLDNLEDELTPGLEDDNCDQNSADNWAFTDRQKWYNSSLSKAYRRKGGGTPTLDALKRLGIIKTAR